MRGWTIALTALAIATADTASWLADRADVIIIVDHTPVASKTVKPAPTVRTLPNSRRVTDTVALAEDQLAAAEVMQGPPGGEVPLDTPVDVPEETASTREEPAETPEETKRADDPPAEPAPEPVPVAPVADTPAEETPAEPAREETPPPPPPPPPVRQVERREPPVTNEPLAIVCMAGCGEKRIVYEAVPLPSRPLVSSNFVKTAAFTEEPEGPGVIECLAGCYDNPRISRGGDTQARHAMRSEPAVTRADNKRQPLGTRIQRWTRSTRSGY